MPFTRRRLHHGWPSVIASIAAAVTLDAWAAGLSAAGTSAVLGQPLDFAVQVRLQPGEQLSQDCVSAEVTVGDRRVPAPQVRAQLLTTGADTARIRVLTDSAIDEPVVGVLLNVGCASGRFARRFVLLADPPIDTAASVAAAVVLAAPLVPAQALSPAAAPEAASGPSPASVAPVPAAPQQPTPPPARAPETAEERQAREARRAAQRLARAEKRAAAARVAAARADPPPEAATPRLRLEPVEPAPGASVVGVEAALQAVAEAASAARAAASAASAAALRIATLERTVAELRGEANAGREGDAELRSRLASAQQASRWTTPLLALVLLMTALAAWLAWRLNGAERTRQRGWQTSAPARAPAAAGANGAGDAAAPNSELTPSRLQTSPIPFVNSEVKLPQPAAARARLAWPAPVNLSPDTEAPTSMMATQPLERFEADNPMLRTEPMPSRLVMEDTAPRDVSIEELLDLEQQAEFFVVLGQDDAAIDLLVEHLRHTGGGSPLPYLKLLEIYRRRGRRVEYERLRERFNQRFNAYAPAWDADLQAGRTLESYSGVIPRLQQVWPRPLDAMAELEALLFRKSRGDLFELPAYREVLFLYALARDLLDREAVHAGQIDLLLPLPDGGEFSSTSPAPYLALERDSVHAALDGKPAGAVDFDLSVDPGRPASIFGPMDPKPGPSSRGG